MRRTILAVAAAGIWLSGRTSSALTLYHPIPLYERVAASTIVVGEIVEVQERETYTLRVDEVWKGALSEKTLQLRQFRDWACAWRWGPYVPGEQVLLFLRQREDGTWSVAGGGCEGEFPILRGQVYSHLYWLRPELPSLTHLRWSYLVGTPLADVRHAVTDFEKHYHVFPAQRNAEGEVVAPLRVQLTSKPDMFWNYWSRSVFHEGIAFSVEPPTDNIELARIRRGNARPVATPRIARTDDVAFELRRSRERDRLDWPAARVRRATGQRESNWQHERMLALSQSHGVIRASSRSGR